MREGEQIYSNKTDTTYTVFQSLKSGGQAEVAYAVSDRRKETYVIKRLLNVRYSEIGIYAKRCKHFEDSRQWVYQEINKWTLHGGACTYIHDFFREKTFYYVVTEKISAIRFDVKQLSIAMPIEDKLFLFRIIAYSFLPLEKANIIHADVKPENILLKQLGERYVAKLIDFESAFHIGSPPEKGYVVGTEPYYSPELAAYNNENNVVDASVLSTKSDIFSLGIILYELLTGEYPIPKENRQYVWEVIKDGGSVRMLNTWSPWSPNLCSLIKRMLSLDPKRRPKVMEILEELKNLTDRTPPPTHITPLSVFIRRENAKVAYVSFLTLNKNSHIFYNTDNMGWKEYKTPFIIADDDVQLDVQISLNKSDGKIEQRRFVYKIDVSTNRQKKVVSPVIKIVNRKVTITCVNPDAIIYYTLNGTYPNKRSPIYGGTFNVDKNVTIKAFARCIGFLPSDVVSKNSSSNVLFS